MSATILLAAILLALSLGLFVFRAIPGVRAYFRFRGKRVITCPETHKPEAVDVAVGEAALGAFLSEPTLRLKQCSRWPERQDCGQECLQQLEVNPENCLVWNIVSKWYAGRKCVFCHKPFGELHHADHAPALLSPANKTVEWKDLRPEQLPEVFSTHRPVCWNCHVAHIFRQMFPELVVDRAPEPRRMM
jgi:hypothetical protein